MYISRKWPFITVTSMALIGVLAVVLRQRTGPSPAASPQPEATAPPPAAPAPAPLPEPASTADAPPEALTPFQRDMQAAAAFIRHLLEIRAVRWLVFLLVTVAAVVGLTSLKPPVSTLAMVLLAAALAEYALYPVVQPSLARWLRLTPDNTVTPRRVQAARASGAAALVLMTGAAYGFLPANETPTVEQSVQLLIAGFIAAGLSIWLAPQPSRVPVLPGPAAPPAPRVRLFRAHYVMIGLGLLGLLFIGFVNSRSVGAAAVTGVNTHLQLVVLLGGIGLFGLGLGAAYWPRSLPTINRRMLLVVLAITALGFFLRFWHLGDLIRNFVDEVNFGNAVLAFVNHDDVGIITPFSSIASFPYLFPYMQWLATEALGRNLLALRTVSAIMGALTVPALYVLARTLFNRTTAIVAALLLATFPVHLHLSRLGLNNIADPLFGTWALAFFARGLVHNRRADFIIGGIFLGLTHYFYEGGRLLYTPLALFWLVGLALLWGGQWRNLRAGVLATAGVFMPIYYNLIVPGRPIFARSTQGSAALAGAYWQELFASGDFTMHIYTHVIPPLLLYVGLPETSLFYGGDGLILVYAVPLFLLGLAYSLWRLRSPGPLLLVLWFVGATFGNTLMVASVHATRFVVVFPTLALLIAVGLVYGLPLFLRGDRARQVMIVAVTAALVLAQADYYFNRHIPRYMQQLQLMTPHRDAHDALLRSVDFPECTHIHVIGYPEADLGYMGGVNAFLNDGTAFSSLLPEELDQSYIDRLDRRSDHAFFVEPHAHTVINRLQNNFDLLPPEMSPYDDIPIDEQYMLLYAPRQFEGLCERIRP